MLRLIFIVSFGLVILTGCSTEGEGMAETNRVNGDAPEKDLIVDDLIDENLVETEWVLTSINGAPLVEGTNITLAIYTAELAGFAGCNGYGSQYEIDVNGGIKILEIESQLEGCVEPEGVLDQESDYLNQLLHTNQYSIEGNVLTLNNSASKHPLLYTRRESFEMETSSLENTEWNLVATESFPLISGSEIRLSFSEGEITGFGGCRDYEGEYEAEDDHIVFPMMMMTSELCDDLELQIQESTFTTWLELTTHYRLAEGRLELFLADGNELIFETPK